MRLFGIIVDEYKDCKFYDIFLSDGKKMIDIKQGLDFFTAQKQIENLMIKYALQKNDLITNNVYDSEGYLSYSEQETFDEYMRN
jgi:hypothetical protein